MRDLSIIIVNWNSADYLRKCLQSIHERAGGMDLEVIVVDNASYDGSGELVGREFPWVRFIQSNENLGFAGANNLGFRHSFGRGLLFLNPDTEVLGAAVKRMRHHLESTPMAGAVGCRLLNTDLSLQTSSILPFPTIINQALDVEYLKLRFPGLGLWGIRPLFRGSGGPAEVDVVSGACIMVKRHVFEEIGLFSTDYFMYAEELDLCHRIRRRGYKVFYINEAEVIHHGGKSTGKARVNFYSEVMMRESLLRFFRKTRGPLYGGAYRITTAIAAVFRLFLLLLFLPAAALMLDERAVYVSCRKWKKILAWSLGLHGGGAGQGAAGIMVKDPASPTALSGGTRGAARHRAD